MIFILKFSPDKLLVTAQKITKNELCEEKLNLRTCDWQIIPQQKSAFKLLHFSKDSYSEKRKF